MTASPACADQPRRRSTTAATSTPQERQDFASISVTETGDYFWNKESVSFDGLLLKLKTLKESNPDPKLFINADKQARFEKVVAVLDEARKLGVTKVAIETQKKP